MEKAFLSANKAIFLDESEADHYPIEFLNDISPSSMVYLRPGTIIKPSSMSPHHLPLRPGAIITPSSMSPHHLPLRPGAIIIHQ